MTSQQEAILTYTVSHFQDVARQNRFSENNSVAHDIDRCAICNPGLLPMDPFAVYLEVAAESVKARRPRIDEAFVKMLNDDLAAMGETGRATAEELLNGDERAVGYWRDWIRDALSTGLGLLSIHGPVRRSFDLDEAEESGLGGLIEAKIEDITAYQKRGAAAV